MRMAAVLRNANLEAFKRYVDASQFGNGKVLPEKRDGSSKPGSEVEEAARVEVGTQEVLQIPYLVFRKILRCFPGHSDVGGMHRPVFICKLIEFALVHRLEWVASPVVVQEAVAGP